MKRNTISIICAAMLAMSFGCVTVNAEETEVETETATSAESVDETESMEVILGDYTGFTYTRTYTEPDVDTEIETIMSYYIDYEETGTVGEGDYIVLSFTGSVDGEEIDGIAETDSYIVVGEGTYGGDFEEKLVGVTVGETTDIEVTYPDDYWQEDLAGNTAVMTVTVSYRADAPELTDEWVSENIGYDTVEEFRELVESYLTLQAEEEADSAVIYGLLEDLYAVSSAEVTDEEITEAVTENIELYEATAADAEMELDEYIEYYFEMSMDEFEEALAEELSSSIEQEKIVDAFIEAEDIDVSEEAYADYLDNEASIYGYDSGEELLNELEETGYGEYMEQLFREYQAGMTLKDMSEDVSETEEDTETTESVTVDSGDTITIEVETDSEDSVSIEIE